MRPNSSRVTGGPLIDCCLPHWDSLAVVASTVATLETVDVETPVAVVEVRETAEDDDTDNSDVFDSILFPCSPAAEDFSGHVMLLSACASGVPCSLAHTVAS